ncbi:MAG: hypothetical protein V1487_02465 [bacterium]
MRGVQATIFNSRAVNFRPKTPYISPSKGLVWTAEHKTVNLASLVTTRDVASL